MRILLAPDKFKGTLTAKQVSEAITAALRPRLPQAEFRWLPLADGGDGTLDACQHLFGGVLHQARVMDALGSPTVARWLYVPGGAGAPSISSELAAAPGPRADGPGLQPVYDLAIIESAEAIGLAKIPPQDRDALAAHTYGLGQLLREADQLGIREVWVGIGGSATTDGGSGMLAALGTALLDEQGKELPLGGGALRRLSTLDYSPSLRFQRVLVLCDVTNPLLGPSGSAAVFSPQKGASPQQVQELEAGLTRLADCAAGIPGIKEARNQPGAGAAGGLGWAFMTFLNAELKPGADLLLDTPQAREVIGWADWIITGEGKLDSQTLGGKAIQRLISAARGKPVSAVVGQCGLKADEIRAAGLLDVASLAPTPSDLSFAMAHPVEACQNAAKRLQLPRV